jgi:hypothetical protein
MCKGALGQGSEDFNRIKWRHNSVLSEFIDSLSPHLIENGFKVYVDLEGQLRFASLNPSKRRILLNGSQLPPLHITMCFLVLETDTLVVERIGRCIIGISTLLLYCTVLQQSLAAPFASK